MTVKPLLFGLLTLLIVRVALSQAHPDFSGRWTPAGGDSTPEQPLIVQQTTISLSVENWSTRGPSAGTYDLSLAPATARAGKPIASWSGTTLVVEFPAVKLADEPSVGVVRTESWSLNRNGTLTVVTTVAKANGPRTIDAFHYRRANRW